MRTLRRTVAILSFALGSCATPTLPLPPPTALVSPPDGSGLVTITGETLPRAYVSCLHVAGDRGVIGRADDAGAYTLRIAASPGDSLELWAHDGVDRSQTIDLLVPGS